MYKLILREFNKTLFNLSILGVNKERKVSRRGTQTKVSRRRFLTTVEAVPDNQEASLGGKKNCEDIAPVVRH